MFDHKYVPIISRFYKLACKPNIHKMSVSECYFQKPEPWYGPNTFLFFA